MYNVNVGENLRKIRVAHKLTQNEVAESLGLERSTYTCYEIGKTEPSIKSLLKMAKMYNVSVSQLVNDCEEEAPQGVKVVAGELLSAETDPISLLKKDERLLLVAYRLLNEKDKEEVLKKIRDVIK